MVFHYYAIIIYLRLSIIFCLSSKDIYLLLGISLSCSIGIVSKFFFCECSERFVNLLAILIPIKSPVASVVVWMTLFEEVLIASVSDYFSMIKNFFWLYLPLKLLLIFLPIFLPVFLGKDKKP